MATYNASTDVTTIANHKVYEAFGKVYSESAPAVDTIFGYTARYFDDDTGLQWNLNRWYDAEVGRWLSEDPIGFAGGDPSLYRYVGNSPSVYEDPDGLAKNRLPDSSKGKWIHGTPGNGVFVYTAHQDQPIVYKDDMPVFSTTDLFVTPDKQRPEVEIDMDKRSSVGRSVRSRADMTSADEEMRARYGKHWKRPDNYTWHHKKLNGTKCTMELVKSDVHGRATHTGPRSILDRMLGLPTRSPNPRRSRGGFVMSPWAAFPNLGSMPRFRGAVRGTVPVAGPIALDFAVGFADDLSDGAVVNFLDNTLGSDLGDMCTNIGRLVGPDWRRHWRYIFYQESVHGGGGRYDAELIELEREKRAQKAQEEAIHRYRELSK